MLQSVTEGIEKKEEENIKLILKLIQKEYMP